MAFSSLLLSLSRCSVHTLIAGTHMWSNGSSRRGRRMSIDLPNMHVTPPRGADGFASSFLPSLPVAAYINGQ